MGDDDGLAMWTVYDHPIDYPDLFVARRFRIVAGLDPIAEPGVIMGATLDEVRALLPQGLICLGRAPGDDPAIVETWT